MPSSKYLRPVKRTEAEAAFPNPPAKCGCEGCTQDTSVLIAGCRIGDSKILHGTIGKDKDGKHRFARKVKMGWDWSYDFSFCYWIARCCDCYERETRSAQWRYREAA